MRLLAKFPMSGLVILFCVDLHSIAVKPVHHPRRGQVLNGIEPQLLAERFAVVENGDILHAIVIDQLADRSIDVPEQSVCIDITLMEFEEGKVQDCVQVENPRYLSRQGTKHTHRKFRSIMTENTTGAISIGERVVKPSD